jgi:hypothetical protein
MMVRTPTGHHVHSHHALLTEAWATDVQLLERGIGVFATPPVPDYHVSLFEIAGDPQLHVNVTHKEQTKRVAGWLGPGVSADGFIYSRRFESTPAWSILRSIHQMVFAGRA